MSKEPGSEATETISAPSDQQQQQMQLQVDDSTTSTTYSTTVRVTNTAEEFTVDFGGPLRQAGPNTARVKIDQRVVLSPWAAKRLALALVQAVQRYEQAYGVLELDARKRVINQPASSAPATGARK